MTRLFNYFGSGKNATRRWVWYLHVGQMDPFMMSGSSSYRPLGQMFASPCPACFDDQTSFLSSIIRHNMQDCGHTCPQNSSKLRALHFNESIKALKYQSQILFFKYNNYILMYVFVLAHAPVAIVSSFVSPPFSASWQLRSECWKDNETELREVSYWGYPELLSVSAPVFAAVIHC